MTIEEWLGKNNQIGIDIWNKKYRRNNEDFEQWLDRVSGGDEDIRRLIKEKKFLFGGRILSNRGVDAKDEKTSMSNCYVIESPTDDIESIYETCKRLARTYSYGGGCGISISNLAPAGAKVRNQAKETSGAVSFMDTFSQVTEQICQNGRRGALMISLKCDHPDIKKFITVKSDLNKVNFANISVMVSDDFMRAVESDDDWDLRFERPETGEVISETIRAKELFNLLCKQNWDYAEPGILFWDTISNYNLLNNNPNFHYESTNPCVSGETKILTDTGYVNISDVCDEAVNVWNGYEFSEVKPQITGENEPMYKVKFSDGSELRCTHYHKFILSDGSRVKASDLNNGDKLIKCDFPIITHKSNVDLDADRAYTSGFFMGDGSVETGHNGRKSIKLYGEKRKLKDYLRYESCVYCPSFDGEFLTLKKDSYFDKQFVPDANYSVKTRLDWLSGYIDSDGTIQSEEGCISISSINREVLMNVKYLLNTLGCNASVCLMHPESYRPMPKNDGTGNVSNYHCQESYRLLISAYNVKKLKDIGLNTHRVCSNVDPNRDASRFIKINDVYPDGICDKVYCFNEPKNHSGIFNGVITAQCGEEPLPAYGSCNLGSINLSEFVEDGRFQYSKFYDAVCIAIKGLNQVLIEGMPKHPLPEQRECVKNWLQTGLGIMGLADCLIKLGIKYGSKEAVELCERIGNFMVKGAINTSCELAGKYGAYPMCNMNEVLESSFFKAHKEDCFTESEIEKLRTYGLRNSQLLTCAPTGTLSSMLGISGGIEPIFANSYTRMTKSLHGEDHEYKVYTPIVAEYMKEHRIEDESDLPDYFVTSGTIPVKDRISMQAVWQKHIDASISSTVNLPHEATVEDVADIYMTAWKSGLKGITVFREGCARTAILTSSSEQEREKKSHMSDTANLDVIGLEKHLNTGCGSLHICAYFDTRTGKLQNTYLSKGSSGGCNNFMIGLSRMISLSARNNVDIHDIVDQLKSCGTCPSYAVRRATKHDVSPGSCCPVAIGNALIEMWEEFNNKSFEQQERVESPHKETVSGLDTCPECGGKLKHEMGCVTCTECGYSKCN